MNESENEKKSNRKICGKKKDKLHHHCGLDDTLNPSFPLPDYHIRKAISQRHRPTAFTWGKWNFRILMENWRVWGGKNGEGMKFHMDTRVIWHFFLLMNFWEAEKSFSYKIFLPREKNFLFSLVTVFNQCQRRLKNEEGKRIHRERFF